MLKSRLKTYFIICVLVFGPTVNAHALNLDSLKISFIRGDYEAAIQEGEKILARSSHGPDLDELYYYLGLSYLKDRNYLRASDIFEIIRKEFKGSKYSEEALLGLADVSFLMGDFPHAEEYCKILIEANPNTKLKAQVYFRLSQAGFKRGDTAQGKFYLDKLKQEAPLNLEAKAEKDILVIPAPPADIAYSVQVGSFAKEENALNLTRSLKVKGYSAYIVAPDNRPPYRVRVGKFETRKEAQEEEKKLSSEGYPTKICP